ncbi:MAG: ABC transporter permease [Anaerolineaceae bacterium]|nr:ABC transporter permease [Anaerolineaceae bacterium]
MLIHRRNTRDYFLRPITAAAIGLLAGGLFVLLTGNSPLVALQVLLKSGFGCDNSENCAILTTLQYATPLILVGLSAAVAFRVGLFSIGQMGQMVLGAAAANWIASRFTLPFVIHPLTALLAAVLFGMSYAILPAILKLNFNINEILSTILLNYIALYLVGFIPSGFGHWIPESARLPSLTPTTKLNIGFFIAIGILLLSLLWFNRTASGYEARMSGDNVTFAKFGGINSTRAIYTGMLISGALAGLAGGIEILGVHYRFVDNFTSSDIFDGVMVALLGSAHPIGILFSSLILGGVRLAAMTGLSIQMGIPRSIGGMMVSTMVIVMGAEGAYAKIKQLFKNLILQLARLTANKKPS